MLEYYFTAPLSLERLRSSGVGAFIDGFAGKLRDERYSAAASRMHLYSAAHVGWFMQSQCTPVEFLDKGTLAEFGQHLGHCQCPRPRGGKRAARGARLFLAYLWSVGALRVDPERSAACRRFIPALAEAALRRFRVDAKTV